MKKSLPIFLVVSLVLVLSFTLVQAQPAVADSTETKITASDGAADDVFGYSVSISGDTVLVGANGGDFYSGSAYVFVRNGDAWTEQQKLTASDGEAGDFFGFSVCVSGDTALIGAWGDNDNGLMSGSAYVFQRNGSVWTEQQKLTASDGGVEHFFGYSVSISGDTAVVGAQWYNGVGAHSGAVYVFQRNGSTWTEEQKLTASDAAAGDEFGISVSVSGDTVVAGAFGDDDKGSDSGSAYVFKRGSPWYQWQKLTASDGAADDHFGYSVAVNGGGIIVIGSDGNDDKGTDSGSAYVFELNGSDWTELQKLLASDGEGGDFFGFPVSCDGDTIAVGAHGEDSNGPGAGAVYEYEYDLGMLVYIEKQKHIASDGASGDQYGISVDVSGNTVAVGASQDDDKGDSSGSAYLYKVGSLKITSLGPSQGKPGEFVEVMIWGENLSGGVASFGPGTEVVNYMHVTPEMIHLEIRIDADAELGPRDITVVGPHGGDILIGGFIVTETPLPSPTITLLSPNSGKQGDMLDVIITGINFIGTEVSFGSGITVNSFTVDSSTQITVDISIGATATTGPRDVSVTTTGGTGMLPGAFTVEKKAEENGNGEAGGCTCGSEEARASATELLVGWWIVGLCWGGGYYLVGRVSRSKK